MSETEIQAIFLRECEGRLADMEQTLLNLRENQHDPQAIDDLFRAAHTVKSATGMVEFAVAENFMHGVENVLERVRSQVIDLNPELIELLLVCKDHTEHLIELAARQPDAYLSGDILEVDRGLRLALHKFSDDVETAPLETPVVVEPSAAPNQGPETYSIHIRFLNDTFRHGFDPISFLKYLRKLGTVESVSLDTTQIPALPELEPESCYLVTTILLRTNAGEAAIRDVFEFMEYDCELTITVVPAVPADSAETNTNATEPNSALVAKKSAQVRVDARQLDRLVDLVGELIISGAYIGQLAADNGDQRLLETAYNLSRQVGELREGAIELRMVPVGGVFSRFRRIVHDLGLELDKKVRFVTEGAETRLDRTLIESLTDPLMHAVRNAIDHGLEHSAERIALGKPEFGTLALNAYREAGEVIIEVRDDGAGLDREKILRRAAERGLIHHDRGLADAEVYALLFEPGFSTADTITSISGRGVGLDVVRRSIEALRGRIEIESPEGAGTILRFRLPLTLAMIEGLLVRVGATDCIVPLDLVHECVEFAPAMIQNRERKLLCLRDEIFPYVDLAEVFKSASNETRRSVVMVNYAHKIAGLVVDELRGQVQSVLKPPGLILSDITAISGNSILGDGSVAIILDVPALLDGVKSQELVRGAGR